MTAFEHESFAYPDGAGVLEDEAVMVFEDDDAASAVVVGVDEAVGEGFADGFVLGRVVYPVDPFEPEGDFEILDEFGDYAAIEVEDVAAPVAGTGYEAVGPLGDIVDHFPEVKEIVRVFANYLIFVAEHEKSSTGGMDFSCRGIFDGCAYLYEEVFIGELVPRMGGVGVAETHAEGVDAFGVEGREIEGVEDLGVDGLRPMIPEHGADFFLCAVVVSGAVALVCAREDVAVDIDGSALSLGAGDVDDEDDRTVKLSGGC